MELVRLGIPYAFIRGRLRMSWRDVRFGLANELLDPMAGIDLAVEQVAQPALPSSSVVEVAGLSPDAPLIDLVELVEKLAESEPPVAEQEIRDRWLYLVLAWTYEHQADYLDALDRIEEIYADFSYPKRIVSFVRYMPMEDPPLGSRAAAEQRMMQRWKEYLDEKAREYGP